MLPDGPAQPCRAAGTARTSLGWPRSRRRCPRRLRTCTGRHAVRAARAMTGRAGLWLGWLPESRRCFPGDGAGLRSGVRLSPCRRRPETPLAWVVPCASGIRRLLVASIWGGAWRRWWGRRPP
eukprot:5411685-Pyramimonas_sp.AAC.1